MSETALIFDCDGVLIDSEAIYLDVEFSFLAERGVHIDRDWYVREFMALEQAKWRQKLSDLLLDQTGKPLSDQDYTQLKARSRERVTNEVTTISGVEDLLGAVRVPKSVASSTQMIFLPGKLERTGLAHFFGDHVYSGDMVENGKPAPDLFLLAGNKMGFEPEKCVVVEDSVNGVRGGKAANMAVIGFTGGSHCGPDHGQQLIAAGADAIAESHEVLKRWLSANTFALSG